MRKESLKKNSSNGVVEDANVDNDADVNGSSTDADPLQGVDQPAAIEVPKKKGRKKVETVTEVAVPIANNVEDDGDYEVEEIINHKFEKKALQFLVRWKNCGPEDDTWEPKSSLSCPDIVKKYLENNPDAEQSAGGSRKRSAAKEKPVVSAKRSRSKIATSTTTDNDSNADDEADEKADDKANGDDEYEVEDIVNHKIVRGKTSFLIRWKNYDSSGDTWEPETSLSCPEIIAKYKEEHMKDVEFKPKSKREAKPKKDKSEKEYEVQLIYDEKIEDGVKHYLVRWKGYKVDDDTWEPEHSLNCPELISKYEEMKKNKRTSGVRGTPKKPTYTEIDETEGEDAKALYINGSSSKAKSKSKSKAGKGKKAVGRPKTQKRNEEDYEVEEIVGEKMEEGKKYYFLKWKGFSTSDNTWELASSLNCPDVLKKYQSKQKNESHPGSSKSSKAAKSPKSGKKTKAAASKTKVATKKSTTSKKNTPPSKPKTKAAKKQTVDIADSNEEQDWEVEKIIDVRYNEDGTKNFLIRWKGCDPTQDTWEPQDNVNSPDLVNEFMAKADGASDVPKKKSRKA